MRRVLTIFAAVWLYVWWCAPAHSQTIWQAARPVTLIDRGVTQGAIQTTPAASIRTDNTTAFQAQIDEAGTAKYGVAVPGGVYWTNGGLSTPDLIGFRLEGAGGGGYFSTPNNGQGGVQTVLVHGDTAQHNAFGTHAIDALGTPLFELSAPGSIVEGINFLGRAWTTPTTSQVQADVLLQIPQEPVTAQGKNTITGCHFAAGNIGVLFGERDGDLAQDNSDTTAFVGFNRWSYCSSCVVLREEQNRQIHFDLPEFSICDKFIDIYQGGNVTIENANILQNGGTLFHVRANSNSVNSPLFTVGSLAVDVTLADTQFPIMVVNTESGGSAANYQHFRVGMLTINNETNGIGINDDGGPCFMLRGAQKLDIGVLNRGYAQMIEAHNSPGAGDHVPQIRVGQATVLSRDGGPIHQGFLCNGKRYNGRLLVKPGVYNASDPDGYTLQLGVGGTHQPPAPVLTSGSWGPPRENNIYIDHRNGVSREYLGETLVEVRYEQRISGIGAALTVADDKATWTVPSELDTWVVTGLGVLVDKDVTPSATGTVIEVEKDTVGNIFSETISANGFLVFETPAGNATLATGDVISFNVASLGATPPNGVSMYLIVSPP